MSSHEVRPHPIFAQRLMALAEQAEHEGHPGLAAELFDMVASPTTRTKKPSCAAATRYRP